MRLGILAAFTNPGFVAVLLGSLAPAAGADPGSRQDRARLFDYILDATLSRTAFSPFKITNIGDTGYDSIEQLVEIESLQLREEFIAADTDEKLFFALHKLSNVRWDSHLHVYPVEGGIRLPGYDGRSIGKFDDRTPHAPVKFKPDYGDPDNMRLFVSDFDAALSGSDGRPPGIGDVLTAVNGRPAGDYLAALTDYHGKSSIESLWWDLAYSLPLKTWFVSPSLYDGNELSLTLAREDGTRYELRMEYVAFGDIDWMGHDNLYTDITRAEYIGTRNAFAAEDAARNAWRYAGFEHVFATPGYDLWMNEEREAFLLQWNLFRGEIRADVQRLVDFAVETGRLHYAIIWDGLASRGGNYGVWILQRLQDKPFRTTFGNLRISDTTQALADDLRANAERRIGESGRRDDVPAARSILEPDNGQFLLEWLDDDLARAIEDSQAYSSNTPFKNYYLPRHSDGIVYPAETHFTGPLVLLVGPAGCSQVDQFVSMVVDNELGHSIGMRAGGCSNTWEWEEDLVFPSTGKPVARYMWTVGHTIRPNGEVMEGNSSPVDTYIPLTAANYLDYCGLLLGKAYDYIDDQRGKPRSSR